jgi:hypothetical protein
MNKFATRVGVLASALAVSPVFAAIDTTAASAGIADAQAAVLTVLGLLITMAAAVFGVYKLYGMLNKKG